MSSFGIRYQVEQWVLRYKDGQKVQLVFNRGANIVQGGGGAPSGGAGGALSGTYPNPGLNTEAVQGLVGAMAGDGLTYDDEEGKLDAEVTQAQLAPVSARAGGFTAGAEIPIPIEVFDDESTLVDGVLTTDFLLFFPSDEQVKLLLSNQTDWADNGLYLTNGDNTATRLGEALQPLKLEHIGRQIAVNTRITDGRSPIYKIRNGTGELADTVLEDVTAYEPADESKWPEGVPTLTEPAIDILAARPIYDFEEVTDEIAEAVAALESSLAAKLPLLLSDFAPNDGASSAREGLVDALEVLRDAGGGELVVDGEFLIDGYASCDFYQYASKIKITGAGPGPSTLIMRPGVGGIGLHLLRFDMLTVDNVTFYGSPQTTPVADPATVTPDCRKAVFLQAIRSATFEQCYFVGIVAGTTSEADSSNTGAVLHSLDAPLVLNECTFAACGGTIAGKWGATYDTPIVRVTDAGHLVVDACRFVDVLPDAYYKTQLQRFRRHPSAHILVEDPWYPAGGMTGHQFRDIHIRSSHFDEATANAITVKNLFRTDRLRHLRVEGCGISPPSTVVTNNTANKPAPLWVADTDDVTVTDCYFGDHGTAGTVAARFEDCDAILLENLSAKSPTTTIQADSDCTTLLHRNLRGTLTVVDSDATNTVDLGAFFLTTPGGGNPDAHAETHENGGDDELALDASQITTGTIDETRLPAPTAPAGTWRVIEERVLGSASGTETFGDLDDWTEIEIRYQGRSNNTASPQAPLRVRLNGDTAGNYNVAQAGRLANANLLSNTTAQTEGTIGYIPTEQTNANRWGTGTVEVRCDQPAASYKMLRGEAAFGASTSANIGVSHASVEWANASDPITSLTLFPSAGQFVAGSRFTVLAR